MRRHRHSMSRASVAKWISEIGSSFIEDRDCARRSVQSRFCGDAENRPSGIRLGMVL